MATYGFDGSTLVDELNRLANGGATYPSLQDYKDEAGAAQAWAAAKSIAVSPTTDTPGVLNIIAGNTPQYAWKDIAGVCNQLAGTTGLEPAAALRQVAN